MLPPTENNSTLRLVYYGTEVNSLSMENAMDLMDVPSFNCDGDMILCTGPVGWTLGKGVEVQYGGTVNRGLISERLLSLDTGDGPWRVELIVQSEE